MSWNKFFIDLANTISFKSKDKSTKVGAVITDSDNSVLSIGYNGFPRGVNDDEQSRHDRPKKYLFVSHAEANAIFNAARNGIRLLDSTLYLNYKQPCSECTKAIIQSGIKRIVYPNIPFPGKGEQWKESLSIAQEMIEESGIECIEYNMR